MFGAINDSEDGGSLPKAKTSAISKICFTAGFRLSLAGFLFVIRIVSGKVRCAYRCENGCHEGSALELLTNQKRLYNQYLDPRVLSCRSEAADRLVTDEVRTS